MSDSFVTLPPDSTGKSLDTEQLIVGINTVQRERMQITGSADVEIVGVTNTDPAGTEYSLLVRLIETRSAQLTHVTSVAVAAGATANLDSANIGSGNTGKLLGLLVSSSVAFKAELQTVLNAVATTRAIVFSMNRLWDWKTPGRDFIAQAHSATAGFDGFRVIVTNLDTSEAADVYVTFFYDEI
jgi:hypothetical protein